MFKKTLLILGFFFLCFNTSVYSQVKNVVVTSLADSGPGTLREAINTANSDGVPTIITFNTSGVISLDSMLPSLTESRTTINGDIDSDGTPDITLLAGQDVCCGIDTLQASQITITGLALRNFRYNIQIHGDIEDIALINNILDYDMNTFVFSDDPIEFNGIKTLGSVKNIQIKGNDILLPSKEYSSAVCQYGISIASRDDWSHQDVLLSDGIEIVDNVIENGGSIIEAWNHSIITDAIIINNKISGDRRYCTAGVDLLLGNIEEEEAESKISNVQIINNFIINPHTRGISLGTAWSGQKFKTIENITIKDNEIIGNKEGIRILNYSGSNNTIRNITVEDNEIIGNQEGIRILNYSGSNNTIRNVTVGDNLISENASGINIWNLSLANSSFIGCRIEGNNIEATDGRGIRIHDEASESSIDCNITNNRLVSGDMGIGIGSYGQGGQHSIITKTNEISYNRIGVHIRSQVLPKINSNNISGNQSYGLLALSVYDVDSRWNYWGATDGPSGRGTGHGDAVSKNATFHPFSRYEIDVTSLDPPEPEGLMFYGNNITNQSRYGILYFDLNAVPLVAATIDIDPDTLNLQSKGKWIKGVIELPEGYDVENIDVNTIMLKDTIPIDPDGPTEVGDNDGDIIPDLMVKFDRQALIDYLDGSTGDIPLSVIGTLNDGTLFKGSDIIKVIDKRPHPKK